MQVIVVQILAEDGIDIDGMLFDIEDNHKVLEAIDVAKFVSEDKERHYNVTIVVPSNKEQA
jgi:hypothetical protein